nr:NADH dehydrogenase subunit 6 [Meloe cavensis]
MILITISIILSAIFISLTHPLSLGLGLLAQTMAISLMTGKFCFTFWFSYILFLIMVGGMLILFIYMTSIASNEKFTFSLKSALPVSALILCFIIPSSSLYTTDSSIKNDMTSYGMNNLGVSMVKYTYLPSNLILTFTFIYLLITLIAIVKIIDKKSGPLRANN